MQAKNLLLLVPPQEYGYGYINDFFWQQGLFYLTSYVQKKFGEKISVVICDGNARSLLECKDVIKEKDYFIVGIHCVDHTKRYAIELAKLACDAGCKRILFGGSGAIFSPEQYLESLKQVDSDVFIGCCTGAGEYTLQGLLLNKKPAIIPNLVYRKIDENGKALTMKSSVTRGRPPPEDYLHSLHSFPLEVYSDIQTYLKLQSTRQDYPYPALTYSGLSHDGCIHRCIKGNVVVKGCNFCAIPSNAYVPRNPTVFWKQIIEFNKFCRQHIGKPLQSIKDWGDSVNEELLKNLIRTRPPELSTIKYSCYLSISEMNEHILKLLEQMNCYSLYMGIDGANNNKLHSINKTYTLEDIWRNLELLKKYNFKIEIGTLLGLEGETQESLSETVRLVERVGKMFHEKVIVLQGNILVPYPGSQVFLKLREKALALGKRDPLLMDVHERVEQWLQLFTRVNLSDCVAAQKQIELISPRKHSYICRGNKKCCN